MGRTCLLQEHVLDMQCEKNKEANCNRSETAPGCNRTLSAEPLQYCSEHPRMVHCPGVFQNLVCEADASKELTCPEGVLCHHTLESKYAKSCQLCTLRKSCAADFVFLARAADHKLLIKHVFPQNTEIVLLPPMKQQSSFAYTIGFFSSENKISVVGNRHGLHGHKAVDSHSSKRVNRSM